METNKYHHLIDSQYDTQLLASPSLRWLPWIGLQSSNTRLLIVGESHYFKKAHYTDKKRLEEAHQNPAFTREIIHECPISRDWPNRTLRIIQPLLLGVSDGDPNKFWQHISFFNVVQKILQLNSDRPSSQDFSLGWSCFIDVARILRPRQCVFLGSTAKNTFTDAMSKANIQHSPIKSCKQIGRCWSYKTQIQLADDFIPIFFIQHPGRYFSTQKWHAHLSEELPEMMNRIQTRHCMTN